MMSSKILAFRKPCDMFIFKWIRCRNSYMIRHFNGSSIQKMLYSVQSKNQLFSVPYLCKRKTQTFSTCCIKESERKYELPKHVSVAFLEFHKMVTEQLDGRSVSISEWEDLETKVLKESPNLAAGFDFMILKVLKHEPDLSVSFLEYIRSKRQPNLPCVVQFMANCAEKHDDLVMAEYQYLLKNFKQLEINVRLSFIAGALANTRYWKQAFELMISDMEYDKPYCSQTIATFLKLFKLTLKFENYEMFLQLWDKLAHYKMKANAEVVSSMFYETWKQGMIPLDLLLELLKLDDLQLKEAQAEKLEEHVKSHWQKILSVKISDINSQSDKCPNCGTNLHSVPDPIDMSMFREMNQQILNKMLVGSNIFKASNLKELDRFQRFIQTRQEPYNYIVDGKNVSCLYGQKTLFKVLKGLSKLGNKVLVVEKSKGEHNEGYKSVGVDLFPVDIRSYDDCYQLLAAFFSGPHCYVVTNDNFSDHISKVDPKYIPYFIKWRNQNRVLHFKSNLIHPPQWSWTVHESRIAWHIPFSKAYKGNKSNTIDASVLELLQRKFLCIQKLKGEGNVRYTPSAELVAYRNIRHRFWKNKDKIQSPGKQKDY